MDKNLESFKEFMKQRENAARAYVCGKPDFVAALTTNIDPVTFFGPNGAIFQSANEVLQIFNQGAAMFDSKGETSFEVLSMAASDTLAYWVGIQRANVQMKGSEDTVPMNLRITEIFRREGNEWKLIHRHADMLAS